jgi:hypothetical protein
MIKLYREQSSPQADSIEAEFHESLLGYDRVILTPRDVAEQFGHEHSLPILTDNEKVVSGEALPAYVSELQTLMRNWLLLSGGTCYVDDKGNGC